MVFQSMLVFVIFITKVLQYAECDFYDSYEHTHQLIDVEKLYFTEIDSYLKQRSEKLDLTKRLYADIYEGVKHFETSQERIDSGQTKYLVHPAVHPSSAVELTHRMSQCWHTALSNIFNYGDHDAIFQKVNTSLHYAIPTEQDLLGVYSAISRLQVVYGLSSEALSKGRVASSRASPMSLDDCRNMGIISIKQSQLRRGMEWFRLAQRKTKNPRIHNHLETLWRLAKAGYEIQMDSSIAENETVKVEDEPEIDDTSTMMFWQGSEALYTVEEVYENSEEGVEGLLDLTETVDITNKFDYEDQYMDLCRKEQVVSEQNLKCHLQPSKNIPYVLWKREEISTKPPMWLYYDMVTEKEVETLKEIHLKHAFRAGAGIWNPHITEQRTGRIYFLIDKESEMIERRISNRIADITGRNTTYYSEKLQISHYGLGGHYLPHYDANNQFDSTFVEGKFMGDRWATFMIYLNEVKKGGSTVFPITNAAIKPVKYAAAFWLNIDPKTGYIFKDSLHAGCPVLLGSKWVANKWIHNNINVPMD